MILRFLTLTAILAALIGIQAPLSARELDFASWDGAYREAIRKVRIEPFMKEVSVKVIEDTEPENAKIKATIETGIIFWDVVTRGSARLTGVAVWRSDGAQPVQALGRGNVGMALGWIGCFQAGIDRSRPIAMSWRQSVTQARYFMIVKGAPQRDTAVTLLDFIETPRAQFHFSRFVAYQPPIPEAMPLIDAARVVHLPTTPKRMKGALFEDSAWRTTYGQAANEANTAMMRRE